MFHHLRTSSGVLACALSVSAFAAATPPPPQDALGAILDKATAYVASYVRQLSSTVSEERYQQHQRRSIAWGDASPERRMETRTLLSDYLLVQMPGSTEWTPFRDVFSVDGRPVRDRNDRLLKLFVESTPDRAAKVLEIREENSRFNLGDVTRDINVPTFALEILTPTLRPRFQFELRGRDRVGAFTTMVVEYREVVEPTIIRGSHDAENVPATGRFWIEPDTGAVLRTLLETRPKDLRTRIEVTYRHEPKLGILVPAEMDERHELRDRVVEARATYSNVRRFNVDTTFEIK